MNEKLVPAATTLGTGQVKPENVSYLNSSKLK